MGADLLLASLRHRSDKKLDWAAGRRAAKQIPRQWIAGRLEECCGYPPETAAEGRALVNDYINDLKAEINNPGRDGHVYEIKFPGSRSKHSMLLHIRGGTSWGDDPSEGFTIFSNIGYFPEVLKAIGFEVEA